ncbi:MAG: hypothetical protein Q4A69_03040 [Moraxella sp.]|nr:hypothetical protein [Moraxella sp.]
MKHDDNNQKRHILSMMGVAWWVNKRHKTQTVPPMADRLVNPRISHLLPAANQKPQADNDTNNARPIVRAQKKPALVNADLPKKPAPPPKQKNKQKDPRSYQALPQRPTDGADNKIEYQMQGVRFGHWVLVADMTLMDSEARFLWSSLTQALGVQAQSAAVLYHCHQTHYPLLPDAEHHSLALARQTFLGFMLRLLFFGGVNIQEVKVAFLTPLTAGVDYTKHVHHLPSIDEMLKNPQLKKQLWTTLLND